MDLFSAMLVKGIILGIWAVVSELMWPEDSIVSEERGCYRATQGLPRLPSPENARALTD